MSEFYAERSYFLASYHPESIRNAVLLQVGYFPFYFLAACIYRDGHILKSYQSTIVFSGLYQFIFSLPYIFFHTWFAIAVHQNVETTVLMCTLGRMGTAVFNFASYNALTAISISRLSIIIFKCHCGFLCNSIVFIAFGIPAFLLLAYLLTVSVPVSYMTCSPMLFYYETLPIVVFNGYIFAVPLIAVILNSITIGYLILRRHKNVVHHSDSRTVDEIKIAAVLLIQSIIPALTISSIGYRSLNQILGFSMSQWITDVADTCGYATTGLNMAASMMFIKTFQIQFKQIFLPFLKTKCDRTRFTTVTSVHTITPRK